MTGYEIEFAKEDDYFSIEIKESGIRIYLGYNHQSITKFDSEYADFSLNLIDQLEDMVRNEEWKHRIDDFTGTDYLFSYEDGIITYRGINDVYWVDPKGSEDTPDSLIRFFDNCRKSIKGFV